MDCVQRVSAGNWTIGEGAVGTDSMPLINVDMSDKIRLETMAFLPRDYLAWEERPVGAHSNHHDSWQSCISSPIQKSICMKTGLVAAFSFLPSSFLGEKLIRRIASLWNSLHIFRGWIQTLMCNDWFFVPSTTIGNLEIIGHSPSLHTSGAD